MTPERQARAFEIFDAAIARPPAERERFVALTCVDDEELGAEVRSLLAAHADASGFMAKPAMPLAAGEVESLVGRQVGPYRILSLAGAGGMGDVYRARDGALARDVAIKILPSHLAGDAERQARFAREARALAALNHPHIGAIYGLEDIDGSKALVLEFVEGPTVADLLRHGPLPLAQALAVARDVAEALVAAHDHSIIHRDLKPSNVVLQGWPAGVSAAPRAKVIDFGLSRLVPDAGDEDPARRRPAPDGDTLEGRLLGSPPYMSPEQARGLAVDRRTDVWAFGCLLFEMLTGRPAFKGATVADTLARILERDPDWAALPTTTPEGIRRLLRRSLEKDAARRLRDMGDVRLEVEEALESPPSTVRSRRQWIGWLGVACGALVILGGLAYQRPPRVENPAIAFPLTAPATTKALLPLDPFTAISPDGRHIAFTVRGGEGSGELWVRSLEAFEARVIQDTQGALIPFWSPDSKEIAFFSGPDGQLKAVPYGGGPVRVICAAASPLGGTWNRDGTILFSTAASSTYQPTSVAVPGLHRVPAAGGVSTPIALAAGSRSGAGSGHRYGAREGWPSFLPDGRHFLYLERDSKTIRLGALDSSRSKALVEADSQGLYAPPGFLLFVRDGTLLGQVFDVERLEVRGDTFRIAENVRVAAYFGGAVFSVSETGVLAYSTGMTIGSSRAAWLDRTGRPLDTVDLAASSAKSRLSPDGSQLAHARLTMGQQADLWVMDLTRRIPIPLTSSPADETSPVWSPDGTHLAYISNRSGAYDIYRIAATGSAEEEMLFESGHEKVVTDWSSDSQVLAFTVFTPETRGDIWLLDLQSGPRATPLLATAADEGEARFSPDGRWLAYESNRTGRQEINVQRLPSGISVPVSVTGGSEPFWSHDGRRLFYSSLDYYLMSVEVDMEGSAETVLRAKSPTRLFKLPEHCYPLRCDISVDRAGRFLVVTADAPTELMRVVSNWMSRLGR